jgi:AcrR family transcriptional regulator
MLAAFEEMNARGVRFTMADLAGQLAVSKTTIYQHFASKDELIGAILEACLDDIRRQEEEIIAASELSFLEKLERLLSVFPVLFGPINNRLIDDAQRHLPALKARIDLFKQEKWQRTENLIRLEIDAGRLRPVNLAVLRQIYMLVSKGLVDYTFLTQNNLSAREAIATFAEILSFGLMKTKKTP